MNKFLFTDGMNGVKEATSLREIRQWCEAAPDKSTVRIWVFNSSEWITYDNFLKHYSALPAEPAVSISKHQAPKSRIVSRSILAIITIVAAVLVFNFTKVQWSDRSPVTFNAGRPGNVPVMDVDSIVSLVESRRNMKIDRNTRNNLRLRNTWPDRLLLQVRGIQQVKGNDSRYKEIIIAVDNTTGLQIDEAVVKIQGWRKGKILEEDTVHFSPIRYGKLAERKLKQAVTGDSLSVLFLSVKATAFNFCYSSSKANNSGNYNDRWFCREK